MRTLVMSGKLGKRAKLHFLHRESKLSEAGNVKHKIILAIIILIIFALLAMRVSKNVQIYEQNRCLGYGLNADCKEVK